MKIENNIIDFHHIQHRMLIVSVDPILLLFCTREWAIYTADFAGYALVGQAHAHPIPRLALPGLTLP